MLFRSRFDPPSNIATPLNAQGKIASTDINDQISLFDMKVVGSAKGNLLGYYNYGLLSPATGQNMKTSIDRIGTGLRSLRWFVAGNVLESISSGGQSNTGQIATQVAQAQIMANKLKTLDQHWKLIKDYQNPENNLLNDEKQMQKEFSMN